MEFVTFTDPVFLLAAGLGSFVAAEALVLTRARHIRFSGDEPGAVQKVHLHSTPRIGGVGIYLALLGAALFVPQPETRKILQAIVAAGALALAVGLLEDVTKRLGVPLRLATTLLAGALACLWTGAHVSRVDLEPLDMLLRFTPVAIAFTAIGVAGITNAINMIDGFHGLAGGTVSLCLLALAGIAHLAGDPALAFAATLVVAAVAGFLLVNFPWGKLFLGDGGAYFVGFALAWLAVLLPLRNPSVSPWASLLVCAYPITEALYSIVRRHRRRRSPGGADREHLHSLFSVLLVRRRVAAASPPTQHALVSASMWVAAATPAAAAVLLYRHTELLILCAGAYLLLYHWIYARLRAIE